MTVTREDFEEVKALVSVAARSSEGASAAAERASTAVASRTIPSWFWHDMRSSAPHGYG